MMIIDELEAFAREAAKGIKLNRITASFRGRRSETVWVNLVTPHAATRVQLVSNPLDSDKKVLENTL